MSIQIPERLDGETVKAYEAFLIFLTIPTPSLSKAYKIIHYWQSELRCGTFYRWAKDHRWKERRVDYMQAQIESYRHDYGRCSEDNGEWFINGKQ